MSEDGVLPYLDIPFQHASPAVLKRMRRPAHAEDTLRRIESWRAQRPELTLRSTFIVGFPGETEAEFEQLLDWLDAAQLDRVGCFKYSPVEGAAANAIAHAVPDEVKQERYQRFMRKAGAISARAWRARSAAVPGAGRCNRGRRRDRAQQRAMRPRSTASCASVAPARTESLRDGRDHQATPTIAQAMPARRRSTRALAALRLHRSSTVIHTAVTPVQSARLMAEWPGMHSSAAIHSAVPKCITIGVMKVRRPGRRTMPRSDPSAITTNVRPVRPAAEDPTMT
jgi:hypothetical protein